MDRKAMFAVVAVVVVVVAAVAVYGLNRGEDDSSEGTTVTDMLGRNVEIPGNVDSIVCLSAGSVRLACYMGAADMIVGIDKMDAMASGSPANYDKATYRLAYNIKDIRNVGGEDSFREIISTGANLIVTSLTDSNQVNTLQQNTGIPTIAVSAAGNIDVDDAEFDRNVQLMGQALGKEARAAELIEGKNTLLKELEDLKSKSGADARCYVGGMFYMMTGDLFMTTGNYASFDYTAATNVMPDTNNGNPYTTTARVLADSGAEYIFVDSMTYAASKAQFDENRIILENLGAVRDGNIHSTLVFKYYGTNWEAELINAYYMGSVLDPEVYDFDFREKVDQILDLFFPGSDLDYGKLMEGQSPGCAKLDW